MTSKKERHYVILLCMIATALIEHALPELRTSAVLSSIMINAAWLFEED